MKFTFKHLSGSRAGQEQVLEGSVVGVGRSPTNQLAFDPAADDRVSGNHAQVVVMADGQVTVNDLGSSNGTFVNGQPVTGPTPVPSGAVIQFGSDGGPKVLVTYTASVAPAAGAGAAAPAPKKGGGGRACLFGCLALLLLGLCGVTGYLIWSSAFTPGGGEVSSAAEVSSGDQAQRPLEDDGTVARASPPTEAPPPAAAPPARKKIPWARLGVGSSFEMKSSTEMKMGEQTYSSESVMRQTLVALDDQQATIKTEVIVPDVPVVEREQRLAIYPEAVEATGEQPRVEERPAEVTVPAGTFSCTHRKTTTTVNGQETVTETWSSDDLPLPYKMVSVGPQSRTVTELTKLDEK